MEGAEKLLPPAEVLRRKLPDQLPDLHGINPRIISFNCVAEIQECN